MNNNLVMEMTKGHDEVNRRREMKALVEKWSRTGLLAKLGDGKDGAYGKQGVIARLLENQAVEMRKGMMNESTQTGDVANFNKIAFPLVRRVFGQLLANEIVSVQPMSLPAGLLFYLDFKYDRNKNGFTSGGSVYGTLSNTPPNNNQQLEGVGTQTTSGGFYNLSTGYSKRAFQITSSTAPTYSGVTATSQWLSGSTVSGYNFTLAASGSTDLGSLHEIRPVRYGEFNFDAAKTFRSLNALHSLTGNTFNNGNFDPNMTYVTGGKVQIFTNFTPGQIDTAWSAASVTAVHLAGPARTNVSSDSGTNNLGDFESTSAIPEINLSVSSVAVTAQTRKLKAKWTPELAQDLNAYHALDAEVELTTILSEVISTEIDRDILAQLLSGAAVKAAWSRAIGRYVKWNTNDVITDVTITSSNTDIFTGTQQDWYQTLGETVTQISNEIHKRTLRSKANWLITSPEVSTVLESIVGFKPMAVFDPAEVQYSLGIEKVGQLANRFTVYVDPYFPVDKVLVGYKGAGFLDAGFVYAPYVPLVVTPTIFEPEDFTPRKGVMHRAATQMVRAEYYGRITVVDLNIIGSPVTR
jgi:hypothetical protein